MSQSKNIEKLNDAINFHKLGNFAEAKIIYKEIIEIEPSNATVYKNLGLISFHEKNNNKSINYFNKAIEIKPDYFDAYFNLGVVYRETEIVEKAIQCFKNAIELEPDNIQARTYLENCIEFLKNTEKFENKLNSTKKQDTKLKKINLLNHKGPKVIVYSYNNAANFGDRLGYHLIPLILPANAHIDFVKIRPFEPISKNKYDLLIMGTGNSLFEPIINQRGFINLLKSAKKSIGIFGTQYRESINPEIMDEVITSLDLWFARYQEDIDCYGKNKENTYHLGDWLISMFPLTQFTKDEIVVLGKLVKKVGSLDRLIQYIQLYRKVYSKRLHSLLCALCSAEYVAYEEQFEYKGQLSEKFNGLLLDIFGEIYPQKEFFAVNRQKVIDYRIKVLNNMEIMKSKIKEIL